MCRKWYLVIAFFSISVAGCAMGTATPLSRTNAELLKGTWVGTWQASYGGMGPYEFKVATIDGDKVTGSRSKPSQKGGTTLTSGKIEGGLLLLDTDKGPDHLIQLQLYRDDTGKDMWLRGSYSTTGRYYATGQPGVFRGTLDLKKQDRTRTTAKQRRVSKKTTESPSAVD
jgi:hypothetical protein